MKIEEMRMFIVCRKTRRGGIQDEVTQYKMRMASAENKMKESRLRSLDNLRRRRAEVVIIRHESL